MTGVDFYWSRYEKDHAHTKEVDFGRECAISALCGLAFGRDTAAAGSAPNSDGVLRVMVAK
jgi:hypothetical protein